MSHSFLIAFIIVDALVVMAVLLFFLKYRQRHTNTLKEIFERQALKRNGEVVCVYFGLAMFLKFPFKDLTVMLRFSPGGKNAPPNTCVECRLNSNKDIHMHVYRENFFTKFGKKLGLKDIQTYNPEFDEAFVISGNDESLLPSVLDHEVQYALLQLKDKNPQVYVSNDQFKLIVVGVPKEEHEYDLIIDSGLTILKRIKEVG
jgi:hypothetical protein